MKIIEEPIKNIALLWGRPKAIQTTYRPMKYLLKRIVDNELLLYNIVTSEMVLLDKREKLLFEGLPASYNSEMDELIAHHFIVPEGLDESRSVLELRALIKKLEPSKRVTGFTILPTTECNARCYYCFESDHKHCTMTEKMVPDVIDYIVSMCKSKPVAIIWFGGEPLVGRKRISQICNGLKQRNVEYNSTMISNGYLFDHNLIQVAKKDWNLTSVQITLDGTENVYNAAKAYINPKDNPYKRVLGNIDKLLSNEIAVSVRLNVTSENVTDLNDLIDELNDRFGGKKGFSCYSHAVYEGVGFEPLNYNDTVRELIETQTAALDNKLNEMGLVGSYSRLPALRVIQCMADNDSSRLIYPDGTIGKCENKSSAESIGDIYNDIVDEDMYGKYRVSQMPIYCRECCLFPDCVNLSICPETGKCSIARAKWKVNRFIDYMFRRYEKDMNNLGNSSLSVTDEKLC